MKSWKPLLRVLFFSALLGLFLMSSAEAEFVLNASCSSQIAEAFQNDLLVKFMDESGVKGNITIFSSEVCLDRLRNGFSNLAGSTLGITIKDREAGLIEIPVCQDPMVIITNPSCGVTNLSLKQVRHVFSGFYTNWKDLGGADLPITLVIPTRETGAYQNFKKMAMGPFEIRNDLSSGKSFTALTAVKYIPGSVSFISHAIASQHTDIKVIHVDGVEPRNAKYPYKQTFYVVVKGEPDAMMKEVINYLLSDKARDRMVALGMKPLL